jgi:hypothetical protein
MHDRKRQIDQERKRREGERKVGTFLRMSGKERGKGMR